MPVALEKRGLILQVTYIAFLDILSKYYFSEFSLINFTYITEISRILSFFLIGVLFCVLTSETTKITVTSLRPYFLAVCKPNITAKDCLNEFGTQKFVENYVCKEKDDHILKEAVKSFFSGHAAFSFYGATFIILYLQSRLPALTVFRQVCL